MSLGLIITIFAVIIKLLDIILKKMQANNVKNEGSVEEQVMTKHNNKTLLDKAAILMNKQVNDVDQKKIQKRDVHQMKKSKQYRQHHRPDRTNDKNIVKKTNLSKNMISDDNSPIFTAGDLSQQQLIKNIIFSEIMSQPKGKR